MNNIVSFITDLPIKESFKLLCAELSYLFLFIQLFRLFFKPYRKRHGSFLGVIALTSILLRALATKKGVALLVFLLPDWHFIEERILFITNPWHPKHLMSLGAFILALPILFSHSAKKMVSKCTFWMLLFNTLTARPLLHLVNQLLATYL